LIVTAVLALFRLSIALESAVQFDGPGNRFRAGVTEGSA